MNVKQKTFFILFIAGLVVLVHAIIFAENGLLDLLRLRQEKQTLRIDNSRMGLKLIREIDLFKRLAENDPQLIEHIARTELNMVAKEEVVFVPENQDELAIFNNKGIEISSRFRMLTEDEFEEILKFKNQTQALNPDTEVMRF